MYDKKYFEELEKKHSNKKFYILKKIDIANVTNFSKDYAEFIGFDILNQMLIATSVSELATNIIKYAISGYIYIGKIKQGFSIGIEVIAEDYGSGIKNRSLALSEGQSSSTSLGLGLYGVRRVMDEFLLDSEENLGTKIIIRKWI